MPKIKNKLRLLERSVELLSPINVLRKGYTMTLKNGEVAFLSDLQKGDESQKIKDICEWFSKNRKECYYRNN